MPWSSGRRRARRAATGERRRRGWSGPTAPSGRRSSASPPCSPRASARASSAPVEDVTERLAFEAQLAHQANHDPLTGLPNRTLLARVRQPSGFRPGDGGLACIFLDLDNFKVVNDSLGHAAGDQLLVELARRLRATVRPGDLVARFGGDEFVVVCQDVDEDDAVALAERIGRRCAVRSRSAGSSAAGGERRGDRADRRAPARPRSCIRDCDIAMYQAKAAGKGRITVLDSDARAQAGDKLRLVAELREAIERREIDLVYQPIFRTEDGRGGGVEALARWRHPERGAHPAGTFVPLAEESGLVSALGPAGARTRPAASWPRGTPSWARPPRRGRTSTSRPCSWTATCRARRARRCSRHGLHPCRLSIELTESALMKDPGARAAVLLDLRDLGVQVSIDDFGTGYSSLAYLRRLPVDCLKVDRSFVAEMADGHPEIAEAVIALAAAWACAPSPRAWRPWSRPSSWPALGATYLQGFGLAAPLTGADAAAWFAAQQTTPTWRRRDPPAAPSPGPCARPGADLRPRAGAGQHRHDGRAAPGGRADRRRWPTPRTPAPRSCPGSWPPTSRWPAG